MCVVSVSFNSARVRETSEAVNIRGIRGARGSQLYVKRTVVLRYGGNDIKRFFFFFVILRCAVN